MAMKPRDAAKAKGCIDSVISFTKTKLLPHVPEMTIRLTHSAESDTFPGRLSSIGLMGNGIKGGLDTAEKSEARRLGPARMIGVRPLAGVE